MAPRQRGGRRGGRADRSGRPEWEAAGRLGHVRRRQRAGVRMSDMVVRTMTPQDWPSVARIYAEGIATRNATFETGVPAWADWDAAHTAVRGVPVGPRRNPCLEGRVPGRDPLRVDPGNGRPVLRGHRPHHHVAHSYSSPLPTPN